jgi:hypothetical protein
VATGGTVAVLFDGDLRATPGTVKAVVDLDSSGRTEPRLLDTIIPLAAGIAGAVALAAGILLVRKPRQAQPDPAEPSRHLAAG